MRESYNFTARVILKRQTGTQAMTVPTGCANIGNRRECLSEAGLVSYKAAQSKVIYGDNTGDA